MVDDRMFAPADDAPNVDPSGVRVRVNSLEHTATLHEQRITALEHWRTHSDIKDARGEEQMASFRLAVDKDMTSLKESLTETKKSLGDDIGSIAGTLQWITRLLIGGIALGVVAFLMNGGFTLPP